MAGVAAKGASERANERAGGRAQDEILPVEGETGGGISLPRSRRNADGERGDLFPPPNLARLYSPINARQARCVHEYASMRADRVHGRDSLINNQSTSGSHADRIELPIESLVDRGYNIEFSRIYLTFLVAVR